MKDRLQKIITSEKLTPAVLADEIGVQRSGISHILSGRNNPGFDFLQKLLARFPELNAEWLLLGQGNMYKQSHVSAENMLSEQQKTPSTPTLPFPEEPVRETTLILDKTVEKIVVFYSDKTFKDYVPE